MISAPQNINGMIGILSGGASNGSAGAVSSPFGALLHAIMNASSQPDAAVVSVAADAKGLPLSQDVAITALRLVTEAADVEGESDIQTSMKLAGDGIPAILKIKTEDGEIIELPVVLMLNAAGSDIATPESSLEISSEQATGGVTGSPMGITIVIPAADSGSEGTTALTADNEILAESALQGVLHQAAQHTPPLAAGITPGHIHRITVPTKQESFTPETVRRTTEQMTVSKTSDNTKAVPDGPEQVTAGTSVVTQTPQVDTANQQTVTAIPVTITLKDTVAAPNISASVSAEESTEQAAVQISQVAANAPVSASPQTVGIQASVEMPVNFHVTDGKQVSNGNAGITIVLPDITVDDDPAGESPALQRIIDLVTGKESASAIEIEISGSQESVQPERGIIMRSVKMIPQTQVGSSEAGRVIEGIETEAGRIEAVSQTPVQLSDTPEVLENPVDADQPAVKPALVSAANVSNDFDETAISAPAIDEPVSLDNAESLPAPDTIQTSIKPEASTTAASEIQIVRGPVSRA